MMEKFLINLMLVFVIAYIMRSCYSMGYDDGYLGAILKWSLDGGNSLKYPDRRIKPKARENSNDNTESVH